MRNILKVAGVSYYTVQSIQIYNKFINILTTSKDVWIQNGQYDALF